ncbi:MAG: UDP-N-acetylmuramoyl-L-alanyl-D-glutamate--2,6-diaminopimelate ligase [Sumerlaeia bacterium]
MFRPNPMLLRDLLGLSNLRDFYLKGSGNQLVTDLSLRGDQCTEGSAFIAIRGNQQDGHEYINQAIAAGAQTIFALEPVPVPQGITTVVMKDTRAAVGELASTFFDHPSDKMTLAAVTGTNGKTSTAWLMASIFRSAGLKTGLMGTLGAQWGQANPLRDIHNTTPDALSMARLLAEMYRDGIRAVALEASSHGIDQERLAGLNIDCAALTNITQDHLDYHKTFEHYVNTKKRLFFECLKQNRAPWAVFNLDDQSGSKFSEEYVGNQKTFTSNGRIDADVVCTNIRHQLNNTLFDLRMGCTTITVELPLVGEFTVSNAAAAASMAFSLGVPADYIAQGIQSVLPVPGRFEVLDEGQPFRVVVDYAHTPDALEKTLRTARRLCARNLICVFGCGGDRDKSKRPLMGRVVDHYADQVILTNDNPRNEDPCQIAREVLEGIDETSCLQILDRASAIERALYLAQPNDSVIICGKGHESYQELENGVRIPFNDREIARMILQSMSMNWSLKASDARNSMAGDFS